MKKLRAKTTDDALKASLDEKIEMALNNFNDYMVTICRIYRDFFSSQIKQNRTTPKIATPILRKMKISTQKMLSIMSQEQLKNIKS